MAQGFKAAALENLEQVLPEFEVVVNTIPAPVLDAERLSYLQQGTLVVDLASLPGGVDLETAHTLELTAIRALSLPARCAPITAGEFVARAVLAMLEEKGEGV